MIEEMVKYLSKCPFLEDTKIKVNYLDGKPFAAALMMESGEPVVKRYADGSAICEAVFILALRQEYSKAEHGNAVAAKRCEDIEDWIKAQNDSENLPCKDGGKTPLSLSVMSSFEATFSGSIDARFEAKLRLVYFDEAR